MSNLSASVESSVQYCFIHRGRIGYIVLYYIWVAFAIVLLFTATQLFDEFKDFAYSNCEGKDMCIEVLSIARLSFSLFLFHIMMIGISLTSLTQEIGDNWWMFKLIMIAGIFTCTQYIPNVFFDFYIEFARFMSLLYMSLQSVVLIDFLYYWNTTWIAKMRISHQFSYWIFLLFIVSAIMWIGSFVFLILLYSWFTCPINIGLISSTLVIGLVYTVLSIVIRHGSLLICSAVILWNTYLCWAALTSQPNSECNEHWNKPDEQDEFSIIIAIVLSMATTVYYTFRKRGDEPLEEQEQSESNDVEMETIQLVSDDSIKVQQAMNDANAEDEDASYNRNSTIFHFYMSLLSLFFVMMTTNWGAVTELSENDHWENMWLELAALWVTVLIYLYTLLRQQPQEVASSTVTLT